MAYVPGFRHDLFISYAIKNNRDGWVSEFANALGEELATALGPQFVPSDSILFEKREKVKRSFPARLAAAARETAILVPVLSPNYLASAWCDRERKEFFSGLPPGAKPADYLAPILLHPIDEALDRRFRDTEPLSFLSVGGLTPLAVGSTEWTKRLRKVAGNLGEALEKQRRLASPPLSITNGTDVFLSHAAKDRGRAAMLAGGLERNGISVWWDQGQIPVGARFEEYLFDRLLAARCVVVVWTHASVESRWILEEAAKGSSRRVLFPILLDPVEVPGAFKDIQYLSLTGWSGDVDAPEFRRFILEIRRFLAEAQPPAKDARRAKYEQRQLERRAEQLFMQNLRSETVIDHVEFHGTAFYRDISWKVNPRMNVLLGRNGYGKTYLLRCLISMLRHDDDAAFRILGTGSGIVNLTRDSVEERIEFADELFDEDSAVGGLPILAIPDARFLNRSTTTLRALVEDDSPDSDRADLTRSGARHFLQDKPYDSIIQTFLYGLCLDYFQAGQSFNAAQFDLIREVVRELTDKSFDFAEVRRESRDSFTLYVLTEGNEKNPLPIQKASQGTLSVIAIFGLIHDFLKALKQDAGDTTERTGIVIIDEVDAHLHPVWQQKIVGLLRKYFPRVQFIITAHSPIVVAGCLEDEVSVLRKDPSGTFMLREFPNDFVGWTPDEIYRKAFEIEQPDESFVHYDALRPFRGEIEAKALELSKLATRDKEQDRSLRELKEQLVYIDKVDQRRAQPLSQDELGRERLLGVRSSQEAVTKMQEQADKLLAENQRLRARLRNAYVWVVAGVFVFAVIFGWVYIEVGRHRP